MGFLVYVLESRSSWPAVAVAIAAVDRAILVGLERELLDVVAALGALEAERGDIEHLTRSAGSTHLEVVHVCTFRLVVVSF